MNKTKAPRWCGSFLNKIVEAITSFSIMPRTTTIANPLLALNGTPHRLRFLDSQRNKEK